MGFTERVDAILRWTELQPVDLKLNVGREEEEEEESRIILACPVIPIHLWNVSLMTHSHQFPPVQNIPNYDGARESFMDMLRQKWPGTIIQNNQNGCGIANNTLNRQVFTLKLTAVIH